MRFFSPMSTSDNNPVTGGHGPRKVSQWLVFTLLSAASLGMVVFFLFTHYHDPVYFIFKESSIQSQWDQKFSIELTKSWVTLDQMPQGAAQTLIDIEDTRFYAHAGYSPFDIHSVVLKNFFLQKKLRGASTITQQLARTLFLNRERTFKRKLQEIRIAVALERSMHKREILEYYLNTVYWGRGFNGIYFASNYHLRKSPEKLTLDEFTHLVHKLKRPDAE